MDDIKAIATKGINEISKQSPTILTAAAVIGVIATGVLAAKATPKAMIILDSQKRTLNFVDYAVLTWREYLPAVLMGVATISCVIGANSINLRRTAALQGIYAITENAFRDYQAKVIKSIGEKKDSAIRDELAQDKLDANPESKTQVIMTGEGEALCYDGLSGRYFKSNIEKIRRVENLLNHSLITEMWVTLNELYDELGLPHTDLGDDLGWDVSDMIEFRFSARLTDTGQACIVVEHRVLPRAYNTIKF